jgi:hypothetical protein
LPIDESNCALRRGVNGFASSGIINVDGMAALGCAAVNREQVDKGEVGEMHVALL